MTGERQPCGLGKAAGRGGWEELESERVRLMMRTSSLSEKPVCQRPRRLADWLNPTGTRKVHSLVDKVYKRKNLELAWEKVRSNKGAGGIDGQSIEEFEKVLDEQLDRLHKELKEDIYRPQPVRQRRYPRQASRGNSGNLVFPTFMTGYASKP